jgi:hypothetical protein
LIAHYVVRMFFLHHSQHRGNKDVMKQWGMVMEFYEVWHPRLSEGNLVWKKLNDGANTHPNSACTPCIPPCVVQ